MRKLAVLLSLLVLVAGLLAAPRYLVSQTSVAEDFTHFESAHVHPIALTLDGSRLLVVNTPDNRLSVFDLSGATPVRVAEIPVGLEPVSVSVRNADEAWVVNQLSDDVSVVDLNTLHVKATLAVGDEPNDVVFAGEPQRAFVSVGNEDVVKVYDPANLTAVPTVIAVNGRQPRSLVRSADGSKVYASILFAGNRTTVLSEAEAGDSLPAPNPPMPDSLKPAPKVGLIVKQDATGNWRDESNKLWNSKIKYTLHEVDVAQIDANSRTVTRTVGDLAAVNLGLAVSSDGTIASAGLDARNAVRFEPNLRGHIVDTRLSFVPVLSGTPTHVNLNPHVNYAVTPGPASDADSALGTPTGVAWSPDGARVYVTSLASNRLGVLSSAGTLLARVPVVAGPTGVLADPARPRIYVVGRFRNQLQTLSSASLAVLTTASIGFDPTPDNIVNGRRFFYGGFTSGHGEQSCATCHVFGDLDNLAWDLGDPLGRRQASPPGMLDPFLTPFHPMKGPMTTQSLRGLPGTGVLHWRGDRTDLRAFNGAFVGLMGRASTLPDSEMTAFEQFVLPLRYPPNPNQLLDRSMRDAPAGQASAKRGQTFFMNTPVDAGQTCNFCHSVPTGTNGQLTNRLALQESQDMKIPQLRNMYRKTGFTDLPGAVNKRGFGFTHNGATDNLFNFLKFPGFSFASGTTGDAQRRDVESFLLAFDTGLAPAVGAQVTFDGGAGDAARIARMDTLVAQADAGNCDLVANGRVGATRRGWKYMGGGLWHADVAGPADVTAAQLRSLASGGREITVTGVPLGSGTRMGLDRDRDSFADGDELAAGSDPGNPASTPANVDVPHAGATATGLRGALPNPFRVTTTIEFTLARAQRVDLVIYDILGREVRVLARGAAMQPGTLRLTWDGRSTDGREAGAGVYFARLRTEDGGWARMMAKLK